MQIKQWRSENSLEQGARVLQAGNDYIVVGYERRACGAPHMRTHDYYIAPNRTQAGRDVLN
jgi:hypothetical protein